MSTSPELSKFAADVAATSQKLNALTALEQAMPGDSLRDAVDTGHVDAVHDLIAVLLSQYEGRPDEVCDAVQMVAANRAAK